MAMGKQPKYESIDELIGIPDGEVCLIDKAVRNKDFKSEKALANFIVQHIHEICESLFNDKVISFETEYPVVKRIGFRPRDRRLDLYVVGQKAKYLIELKNPSLPAENRYAIGQILDYGREFLDSKKELIILTTLFDKETAATIKHYNLPIRYIYLDKQRILEYEHSEA